MLRRRYLDLAASYDKLELAHQSFERKRLSI